MLQNFKNIKNFDPTSQTHQWGDPTHIDRGLLEKLDALVDIVGSPAVVTSGYSSKDFGSQHALGLACDIMFPNYTGTLRELYAAAETVGFNGLGVYPHWHYAGNTIGGLHLDERQGKRARWMGVLLNGTQQYIALSDFTLKQYGVV
jgi:uncharacterized protein YcbK (DUF882 family)